MPVPFGRSMPAVASGSYEDVVTRRCELHRQVGAMAPTARPREALHPFRGDGTNGKVIVSEAVAGPVVQDGVTRVIRFIAGDGYEHPRPLADRSRASQNGPRTRVPSAAIQM